MTTTHQIGIFTTLASMALIGCLSGPEFKAEAIPHAPVENDSTEAPCQSIEFHGYRYELIQIGDQCWFAENLQTKQFSNGELIAEILDTDLWNALKQPAVSQITFPNQPEVSDSLRQEYGNLYNWYAVKDARNICPNGFHVPSNFDWDELEKELGGSEGAGIRLRDDKRWRLHREGWPSSAHLESNDTEFNALPGGAKGSRDGDLYGLGYNGYWWSLTTPGLGKAYAQRLYFGTPRLIREVEDRTMGFSVRCVED